MIQSFSLLLYVYYYFFTVAAVYVMRTVQLKNVNGARNAIIWNK